MMPKDRDPISPRPLPVGWPRLRITPEMRAELIRLGWTPPAVKKPGQTFGKEKR